jgi:transcriptional regulator with XRE-family HTH domain
MPGGIQMSTFGEKILSLRTRKGLSTKDVAQAVSIPQSRYSELEKGVRIPSESQAARLEEYFGLKADELVSLLTK